MNRKIGKKKQSKNSNDESLKEKLELQTQSAPIAQDLKNAHGITLVALVITILFSYDEKLKCSNSKGFLLTTI